MRTVLAMSLVVALNAVASGGEGEAWKAQNGKFSAFLLQGLDHYPDGWFVRGESVSTTAFIYGCKPDVGGLCKIESEFVLLNPAGERCAFQPMEVLTHDPTPGRFRTGHTFAIASDASLGRYTVVAKLRDAIANKTLELKQQFDVVANSPK